MFRFHHLLQSISRGRKMGEVVSYPNYISNLYLTVLHPLSSICHPFSVLEPWLYMPIMRARLGVENFKQQISLHL